jgi:hypothetical protein
MMNTQSVSTPLDRSQRRLQTLRAGSIMHLGSGGGRLEVVRGRVWLTRAGDLDDHVLLSGTTLALAPSGRVLIEAWDDEPALLAWQATPIAERIRAAVASAFGRCWEIVDPARRIGAGAAAAALALLAGVLVFGPVSESRTRALLAPTLLHNSAGARTSIGLDAGTRTGSANDVSAGARERARISAQEARRGPPGPA